MKHIELATEITKQLITVSAGLIVFSGTFLEKFSGQKSTDLPWIGAAWASWLLSVALGILAMGALTALAEQSEKDGAHKSLGQGPTRFLSMAQQGVFVLGLLLFFVAVI